jgi:hypothetical protein
VVPSDGLQQGRETKKGRSPQSAIFPEDQGRVLSFAGYDGFYADNRSAWIYRATLPAPRAGDNR